MWAELIRQIGNLFTWAFVVAPWEQAIRVRGGKHKQVLAAGIYLRVPFLDRVYKQNTRRRLLCLHGQTLTSADGKIVTVSGAVGFFIRDLGQMYDRLDNPNDTIETEVAGLIADFIGQTPLAGCNHEKLRAYVTERLNLDRYGLGGQEFYLTSFAYVPRAYRLITGEISAWNRDDTVSMREMADERNR